MCSQLDIRRPTWFQLNKKQAQTAADCLYLDMSSGFKLDRDDDVPDWNAFPEEEDLPRKLMGLGQSILNDRGCMIILHQGTLRISQQTVDVLDAYSQVYHLKVEVFCKASHHFIILKLDMAPFNEDNSGRESSQINNYNHTCTSKLDDGGRRKCHGFVQTLLENFTGQGDIFIDFAGGWGATLQAANNCGRCCIVAETRKDALESLQRVLSSLHEPATTNPESERQTQKSLGKKPLGDEDDLGVSVCTIYEYHSTSICFY
ncbi:hypothetical protein R1sor_022525 [Riccia sorocarpa]|uniref:Trimethylguanosine synthase n=1 Tax=Riccia sorocarpa TaxID=122646 RepID=A0ABD3GPB2_9MARC